MKSLRKGNCRATLKIRNTRHDTQFNFFSSNIHFKIALRISQLCFEVFFFMDNKLHKDKNGSHKSLKMSAILWEQATQKKGWMFLYMMQFYSLWLQGVFTWKVQFQPFMIRLRMTWKMLSFCNRWPFRVKWKLFSDCCKIRWHFYIEQLCNGFLNKSSTKQSLQKILFAKNVTHFKLSVT